MALLSAGLFTALSVSAAALAAESDSPARVINFRNGGTGAYPDADPPLEWSVTKNVTWRWAAPALGTTISSPIIVGQRIFTLARPMTLVCLDKDTGRELWKRESHLPGGGGTTSVSLSLSSTDATTRVPPIDELVRAMHEAIVRDGRIYDLASMVPAKGRQGGIRLAKEISSLKRLAGDKNLSEADRTYHGERARELEAILADGEAHRDAYEKELAVLEARARTENGTGFRIQGYSTAASPVSDGRRVMAIFSPGLLVCYDLDGNLQWVHAVLDQQGGMAATSWGNYAQTPQVADGKLLVSWGGVVQGIDIDSGNVLWARELTKDYNFAAASPAIGSGVGTYYFMLSSGEVGRLADGQTVFTANTDALCRYFATAVSADGRTLSAVRDAVRLPSSPGQAPSLLWALPESALVGNKGMRDYVYGGSHQYCAPVIHDLPAVSATEAQPQAVRAGGILYYHCTHSAHSLAALDLETGEQIYRTPAGTFPQTYSDLILAGDYLFMFRGGYEGAFEGVCQIMKAGREFELLGETRLEKVVSNDPVFEGRRMYVRTHYSLFCIEDAPEGGVASPLP